MQTVGASGLNRPVTCSLTRLPSLYVAASILSDPVSAGTENANGGATAFEKLPLLLGHSSPVQLRLDQAYLCPADITCLDIVFAPTPIQMS